MQNEEVAGIDVGATFYSQDQGLFFPFTWDNSAGGSATTTTSPPFSYSGTTNEYP